MNERIKIKFTNWQLVVLGLSFITLYFSNYIKPNVFLYKISPIELEERIPKSFGNWTLSSNDSKFVQSNEIQENLDKVYSKILNRVYVDKSGYKIMLSIAYTTNQSDNAGQQSHLPEICYPAQGFQVLNIEKIEKKMSSDTHLFIKKMIAEAGERHEPLTYWTVVGSYSANDMYTMKKAQFAYAVKRIIPDGLIFRISSIDSNNENAFDKQNTFIDELFLSLSDKDRARLGLHRN